MRRASEAISRVVTSDAWVLCVLLASAVACEDASKLAPEILSIDPARVPVGVEADASVEGRNFFSEAHNQIDSDEAPTVDRRFVVVIGGTQLRPGAVTFVNTEALDVVLPDTLRVGLHDVTVTTPGGLSATLEDGLEVFATTTTGTCLEDADCADPCFSWYECVDGFCVVRDAEKDADGDGHVDAACADGDDCDDDPDGCGAACHPGAAEICDGLDNDCDASTNDGEEDPLLDSACDGPDSDLCEDDAYEACTAGTLVCSSGSDELDVCDGADNDCDPSSNDGDEDPLLGTACDGPDSDACEDDVYDNCAGSTLVCSTGADDVEGPFGDPSCSDGQDNDCDGLQDASEPGCQQICDPPWWDQAYLYRRRVTVTEEAAGPLPQGYSVAIVGLDTQAGVAAGEMLPSGDDLRIVRSPGATPIELDRRVVDMGSTTTEVWFKTYQALNGSDDIYFIYYGDPSAANPAAHWADSMGADEPSRVYLAADDFQEHGQGDCPDGWGTCGSDWWVEESGAERYLASGTNGQSLFASDPGSTDIYAEARVRSPDPGSCPGIATRVQDVNNLVYAGYDCSGPGVPPGSVAVWQRVGGSYSAVVFGPASGGTGWHTVAVAWIGRDVSLYYDDGYVDTGTAGGGVPLTGSLGLFSTTGTTLYADDITVRMYVDPEPTVTLGPVEPRCS